MMTQSLKRYQKPPGHPGVPTSKHSFGRLIQKINRKLASGTHDGHLLNFVFESLEHLIPFDRIGIALVDDDQKMISLKWVKSRHDAIAMKEGFSAELKNSTLLSIIESGKPRIINDLLAYSRDHPNSESTRLALKDGVRSSFTCPLRSMNRNRGVVFFSSFETNTYADQHIETFLDIADELAVLIEHERLQTYAAMAKGTEKTLATILHDLRSPLSTIHSYIDFSVQEEWYKALPSEAKTTFDVVRRNTEYMFSLLDDLRELSRFEGRGVIEPRMREVSLVPYASELKGMCEMLTKPKDINLEFRTTDLPSVCYFDREKIRRALDNLVSNAVKYSKRHTTVVVSIENKADTLYFSVKDQGQGIPKEEMYKLFHDFGKTSVRATEGEPSSGLGLAIVRMIAEQHGGNVAAESKVGEGSTFSFFVPLRTKP